MDTQFDEQKPTKHLGGLYKWLKIFMLVYIIGEIFLIIGILVILNVSGSSVFELGSPFTVGDGIMAIGAILALSLFVCIVLFCKFSYRAAKNLKIWGTSSMEMSAGWTVGWYFIPFANLWKPYNAMDQIWDGSHKQFDGSLAFTKKLPWWWVFWIISNIISNISFRIDLNSGSFSSPPTDLELYKMGLLLEVAAAVTSIIAALLILPVLKIITDKQDATISGQVFSD